jgi:hypothetical protein
MTEAHGASGAGETTTAISAVTGVGPGAERSLWREALAPYARPRLGRSLLDLATSVLPYLALWVLMDLALGVSYLLALALAAPAAGFLLRTYIVFHDCAHGSFLASKRANAWLGVALGLGVTAPRRPLSSRRPAPAGLLAVSSGFAEWSPRRGAKGPTGLD